MGEKIIKRMCVGSRSHKESVVPRNGGPTELFDKAQCVVNTEVTGQLLSHKKLQSLRNHPSTIVPSQNRKKK